MKAFQKLALVSAIALSSSAFALEAIDDAAMSATTGQDGIRLGITPTAHILIEKVFVHDNDGVDALSPKAGAIVIGNGGTAVDVAITPSAALNVSNAPLIGVDIDATGDANNDSTNTDPMLNIRVRVNGTTSITTDGIAVANSDGLESATAGNVNNISAEILGGMTITLGALDFNIQLANERQGHMIVLNTAISGGLSLTNVSLNDVNGLTLPAALGGAMAGGSISVASLTVVDGTATFQNGANLNLGVDVDVTADALVIGLRQLGDATNGANVVMTDVALGSGTIGDIEMLGLKLPLTYLSVSGK